MNMSGEEFYVAFVQSSYHVPGDERSRTHPGHGYPAHNVQYTGVKEFKDKTEMLDWVRRQESKPFGNKYRIVKCVEMNVKTEISVEVD